MDSFFTKYHDVLESDIKRLFIGGNVTDEKFFELDAENIIIILKGDMKSLSTFLPIYFEEQKQFLQCQSDSHNALSSLSDNLTPFDVTSMEIMFDDDIVAHENASSPNHSIDNVELNSSVEKMNVSQASSTQLNDSKTQEVLDGKSSTNETLSDNNVFVENDLYHLLNEDLEGRVILETYKHNKILLESRLNYFIIHRVINEYPIRYKIKASRFEELANQVIELFPTANKKDWYRKPTKDAFNTEVAAAGCLLNYYKIFRQSLRQAKILKSSNDSVLASIENTIAGDVHEKSIDLTPLTDENREKHGIGSITETWDKSYDTRSKLLVNVTGKKVSVNYKTYLNTFNACLKLSVTLELLQSDFTSILSKLVADEVSNPEVFERAHTAFTTRWLDLSKGICNVADSAGSHDLKEFKKSVQNIIENVPSTILALFYLPFLLTKAVTVKTPNTRSVTFLREDISEHFIKIIETESELETYKTSFEQKLVDLGHNVHPYLVFCGNLSSISKAYIIFNGCNYEFKNPLEAVHICFKISVALHTWSQICTPVWNYILEHVYGIRQNVSCAFPATKQLKIISSLIKKVDEAIKKKADEAMEKELEEAEKNKDSNV